MYNSIHFDKFIKPHNLFCNKNKKYFYHTHTKIPLIFLCSLPPWSQVINNHWCTFCSNWLEFPFLEFHINGFYITLYLGLCKWCHTVFTVLYLISLTQHNAFEIHAEYYSIAWIYNFLIHLSLFILYFSKIYFIFF